MKKVRRKHVSNHKGKRHVRYSTHYVRVNTHYAAENFRFRVWCDASPPEFALDYIKKFYLCRLQIHKRLHLTPTAQSSKQYQQRQFLRNHIRDRKYDFHCHQDIPGTKEFTLMYNEEKGERPWFSKGEIYWTLNVLGLGWIMRQKFFEASKKVEYECTKWIYE